VLKSKKTVGERGAKAKRKCHAKQQQKKSEEITHLGEGKAHENSTITILKDSVCAKRRNSNDNAYPQNEIQLKLKAKSKN